MCFHTLPHPLQASAQTRIPAPRPQINAALLIGLQQRNMWAAVEPCLRCFSFLGGEITFPDINQAHKFIVIPSNPCGRHPKPPQEPRPTMIKRCQSSRRPRRDQPRPSQQPLTDTPQGVFSTGFSRPCLTLPQTAGGFSWVNEGLIVPHFISLSIRSYYESDKHPTCPTCQTGGVLMMTSLIILYILHQKTSRSERLVRLETNRKDVCDSGEHFLVEV